MWRIWISCLTSPQKSAQNCVTNTSWGTARAINHTTRGGAKSRSSCAYPRDFRLSASTRKQDTTRRAFRLRYSQVPFLVRTDCDPQQPHCSPTEGHKAFGPAPNALYNSGRKLEALKQTCNRHTCLGGRRSNSNLELLLTIQSTTEALRDSDAGHNSRTSLWREYSSRKLHEAWTSALGKKNG